MPPAVMNTLGRGQIWFRKFSFKAFEQLLYEVAKKWNKLDRQEKNTMPKLYILIP